MKTRQHRVAWALVVVSGMLVSGGCASKKMVNDGMSAQDARMDDIETQVEENQRNLKDQGRRVDGVVSDVDAAERAGQAAAARADEAYNLAEGKLLYKVVLDDTAGNFELNSAKLTDSTRAKLDQLASKLVQENRDVFVEIAGHTDASGSDTHNMGLGLRRAESVRRYLNAHHSIPLHRMSVISYGESQPVGDNANKDGRAKNRRVEVRVLS